MKRLSLLLALLAFIGVACNFGASQSPDISHLTPDTTSPDTTSPETSPLTPDTFSLSLLDLQNNPLDENVVKLFSVAVDDENNRVYVAGIMTPDVAILDGATEEWIGVVKTGITERGIKYIYFDSSAQYLYVFETTSSTLRRINVATGEMATPAKLNSGFASIAFVDEVHTRFYLATKNGLTAFDGNTLQELFVAQGLGENSGAMVYEETSDSIYMLASQNKTARSIIVIDAASGKITDEIQYTTQANGRARAFHFDAQERTFIVGLERTIVTLDMNGNELRAFPLKNSGVLEDILYDPATDQTFALSVAQPANGQIAGTGGHVDVYDKSGSLTHSFDFGRKPHNLHLNSANGHIYIANGDASVLWSIDTANPTQANPLRLGDSIEQIVVSGDGSTLYLSSRLGGSYIARYSLVDGSAASFYAGTWPIPLRRDSAGDFLFSLNAWDSTLSVYSMTPSETLLGIIPLGIPAGSTDRLPDLAIDSTHKLAFAAYPEFGTVAVVNWETMQPVTTINIPNAETGDTGGGPGQLQVMVNESARRLFVYEAKARTVYVYDTANNFTLLASVDVKAQSKSIGQADADLFFFDANANRLFLGTVELDSTTGQPNGNVLPAESKLFGMDSEDNLYWVLDDKNNAILAIDRTTLAIRHSQPMPEPSSNLATAAYDPVNKQVFIGYLITANVYGFSVGQIP
jgi:DNA-binding beta-propeller fold protein YncE